MKIRNCPVAAIADAYAEGMERAAVIVETTKIPQMARGDNPAIRKMVSSEPMSLKQIGYAAAIRAEKDAALGGQT